MAASRFSSLMFICSLLSLAIAEKVWLSKNEHVRQLSASKSDPEHWLSDFQSVLYTMQRAYWNGTYWPNTLQWTGAFLDTLLAASDQSFTNTLIETNGTVRGSDTTNATIRSEILHYFSEIEAYYGDEDTIQIFGAAYDDAQWVVLEWLEVIRFIRQYDAYAKSDLGQNDIARFAHRAHIFYNIVQDQFNTSTCDGGLTWDPHLLPYKNAITNELFISSSIAMYLYFPGDNDTNPYPSPEYKQSANMTLPDLPLLKAHDPLLLDNAIKEYEWFKTHNFTNAQELIVDGFHISEDQTTCDQRNEMVYTYNQGVVLSGLRQLWEATGDTTYLDDGYALVATVINATGWYAPTTSEAMQWAGLGRNGIMEDYCDAPANCSQDNLIFKGVYFHHLDLFCEPLPTDKPLVPGLTHLASADLAVGHENKCRSYVPWIEHNAYAALSTRNDSGIIGEWWGANFLNQTQAPSIGFAVPTPHHSIDVWNKLWVRSEPPWSRHSQHPHSQSGNGFQVGRKRRSVRATRSDISKRQSDINDEGLERTVETQGSGLSVVMAALDFTRRRPTT